MAGYPGKQGRKPKAPRDWRDRFLAALRGSGNIRASCMAAGISRQQAYRARDKSPAFADSWEEALQDAVDSLEAVAWTRARASSDTLLIFLLKAHRPETYREVTRTEHTGRDGGPMEVVTEAHEQLAARLAALAPRADAGGAAP